MNILLVRHALPMPSAAARSADPGLGDAGEEMARRLPDALQRHQVTKIVSSPQLRSRQTAAPLAEKLGLPVHVDDRLAEYDRDLQCYTPVEQMHAEDPAALRRLLSGHLPDGVDIEAFRARVIAAVEGAEHASDLPFRYRLRVHHAGSLFPIGTADSDGRERGRARLEFVAEKPARVSGAQSSSVDRACSGHDSTPRQTSSSRPAGTGLPVPMEQ